MPPLSHEDVVAILGPLDEEVSAELLRMDATSEEIALARAWLDKEDALVDAHAPPPSGRVARILELLAEPLEDDVR
jgi:hypothetical protein